jgi:hypothetical protein
MVRFALGSWRPTLLLTALALAACSSTTTATKPPDTPDPDAPSKEVDPATEAAGPAQEKETAPPASEKAKSVGDQNSIPDDYYLTAGDCEALGKQYGHAARNDQLATLSPKLSEKLRAQGTEAIDKAVTKLEDKWIASCQSALVGQVGDPKALKCALNAATVAAFDVCLNGDNGSQGNKPSRAPKKSK